MLSRREVERLARLTSDAGILSAYVALHPRLMHVRNQPVTAFKGAVKKAARKLKNSRDQEILNRESEVVVDFLSRWTPSGRGLAIFSSKPSGIWEVHSLEVMIPTWVDVGTTSTTALLAKILDEYPRIAVVVIQRDRGSLYISEQRIPEEGLQIASDVPGQHEQGGWSQARFERHIEFHVDEHFKQVLQELRSLEKERPFRRMVLAGTDQNVKEFLKMVPESLSRKVIGTVTVDFKHESETAILERSREVLGETKRKEEREIVHEVIQRAHGGGAGILGIEKTLKAIAEGRIHVLLVADGLEAEGSVCQECGHLEGQALARCPLCESAMEPEDLVNSIVEKVFLAGDHVETISGEARELLMAEGGIGGLLRY